METTTKEKSKKLYFSINSERDMEKFMPKGEKAILIRVLEPWYKEKGIPYEMENIDKFSNVLELYFWDHANDEDPEDMTEWEEYEIFTEKMAVELNEFIVNNDFDEVTVHCTEGFSRSPAIAMCIARILKLEDLVVKIANGQYVPNLWVLLVFSKINVIYKEGFKDSDVIYRSPSQPTTDEELTEKIAPIISEEPEKLKKFFRKSEKKRKEFYAKIWGLKF